MELCGLISKAPCCVLFCAWALNTLPFLHARVYVHTIKPRGALGNGPCLQMSLPSSHPGLSLEMGLRIMLWIYVLASWHLQRHDEPQCANRRPCNINEDSCSSPSKGIEVVELTVGARHGKSLDLRGNIAWKAITRIGMKCTSTPQLPSHTFFLDPRLTLLMIQILHDLIYIYIYYTSTVPRIWHMRSCRISIINSSLSRHQKPQSSHWAHSRSILGLLLAVI